MVSWTECVYPMWTKVFNSACLTHVNNGFQPISPELRSIEAIWVSLRWPIDSNYVLMLFRSWSILSSWCTARISWNNHWLSFIGVGVWRHVIFIASVHSMTSWSQQEALHLCVASKKMHVLMLKIILSACNNESPTILKTFKE